MKKNVKIEKKSPLAFKLMFTLIVAVTFAFVWFAGYVFAEKNVEKQAEKTKVVIVMEPQSTAEPVFEVKDDVSAKNIENEVIVEDVVEENEPVVQEKSNSNLTQAYVSIVVDDMGISAKHTKEILSIHAPLTSSFLTYGENLSTYAKEALEAVKTLPETKLLITDMVMPGMNGEQLIAESLKINPYLKAILMSGYSAQFEKHTGQEKMPFAFISKPFVLSDLLAKINEILENH